MPSYEFYEIFKNTLFTQHLRTAASGCTAIRVGVVVVVGGGGGYPGPNQTPISRGQLLLTTVF